MVARASGPVALAAIIVIFLGTALGPIQIAGPAVAIGSLVLLFTRVRPARSRDRTTLDPRPGTTLDGTQSRVRGRRRWAAHHTRPFLH